MDTASAEAITAALVKIKSYMSHCKELKGLDLMEDVITISNQDTVIMAVLARHLYNILTKQVYICKDNAYSYTNSMYVPSVYFLIEDFTKFLMKVNLMFRKEFDSTITSKMHNLMSGTKTNRESSKTYRGFFRKFTSKILGKDNRDIDLSNKREVETVVKGLNNAGYADILVDVVTNKNYR
ncbi:hypothetical protein [Piscirickettsia litoralis]|uniref:hypothetical protein n=1 Tax=Piscirickettsia litoralis TaxID=1891921 RepID=UPI001112E8B9|nr:hypothetical protein [Piscirickettsia litoralis]